MKRLIAIGLVAALGAVGTAGALRSGWLGADGDGALHGRPQPFDLIGQSAVSESNGLRITLTGAQFTGLETYVALEVEWLPGAGEMALLRAASIPREDASTGLAPRGSGVSGPIRDGRLPVIMPFAPLQPDDSAVVTVSAVTLVRADGSAERVAGDWSLKLSPPPDLARLQQVESLAPSRGEATAHGITVTVLSAVRTTADVRVTFGFEGGKASDVLSSPAIEYRGQSAAGHLVSMSDDRSTGTWSFPDPGFGTKVRVSFSRFFVPTQGAATAGTVIDVRGVIADMGHARRAGDTAAVGPARVLTSSGPAPTEVRWKEGGTLAPLAFEIVVPVPANPDNRDLPQLILPSGEIARAVSRVLGFDRDQTGVVTGGRTVYGFRLRSSEDVDGAVVLDPVEGVQVANARWEFELTPTE